MANSAERETDSFYDTIGDGMTGADFDNTVNASSSVPTTPVDPEERRRQEEEWRGELVKLEDEILTLRQVLSNKVREAGELKRKLGITPMVELKRDLSKGVTNIRESDAYQKTNQTLKNVGQKTSSAFSSIGTFTSKKLGDMRNSTAFKSIEEKVGGAVSNVKSYVRPKSTGDLTEEQEGTRLSTVGSPAGSDPPAPDSGYQSPNQGAGGVGVGDNTALKKPAAQTQKDSK